MGTARATAPSQFFPNVSGLCSSFINTHLKTAKSSKHAIDGPVPGTGMPHMTLHDIAAGQTFSHYRLLRILGEGGMGVVYLAEDTRLHRQVAIKFLTTDTNRRMSRARFLREAQAASILNHQNIATVYDVGETDDGRPFIVMELLRGKTLSEVLKAGEITIVRAVWIIEAVLAAIAEAHLRGIVHRDVKPSNIVVGERGQVKVLDFGLAKSLETGNATDLMSATGSDLADMATQTLNGTVLGTPLYVSPEQATGAPTDHRSDLFSIGAVLYECLANRPAFGAPSVIQILAEIINPVPPPPPSHFNPSVPSSLDRVVLRALAKRRDARYQTAEEFRDALVQVNIEAAAATRRNWRSRLHSLYHWIARSHKLHALPGRNSKTNEARVVGYRGLRSRFSIAVIGIVALLLLLIGLNAYRSFKVSAPVDSLAVLPFINNTGSESMDYLSDGLTDSVISSLSRVPGLKVISQSSVVQYRGRKTDAVAVGAELHVRAVLTGRIESVGSGLRVVTELIDTRDRSRIWGESYLREIPNVLSLRDEVVYGIARNLGVDAAAIKGRSTIDPIAYDHYIKGRLFWSKRTNDGLKQAIEHFQAALDRSPEFALAYSGLADAYMLAGGVRPRESYLRAKAAATQALKLDDQLGEAYATLGFIKTHFEHDWINAEAQFKRAIELNPNYATAHHWYGVHLIALGRFEEAQRELSRAQELDPLSPIINADLGVLFIYTRQSSRAVSYLERNRDLFPNSYPAYYYLGWAYTLDGKYDQAIASYQRALELSNRHSMSLAMLGYAQALAGREAEARAVLNELEQLSTRQYVSPYRFVVLYTGLDDKDRAFEWLNKGYEEKDILISYVNVNPWSDTLRQDHRFTEFLTKLGLGSEGQGDALATSTRK